MDPFEAVKAENEALRREVEHHRQRELEDLRLQLAEAKKAVAHYRSEAERNAALGRQIAEEYRQQVTALRERLAALERLRDVRGRGV